MGPTPVTQDIPPPPPGFQIVGQAGPPPRPTPRRPAQPATAGAPPPTLNDLGITDAEERDALIYQGYTPEQADAFMSEGDEVSSMVPPPPPGFSVLGKDHRADPSSGAIEVEYLGPLTEEDRLLAARLDDPEYAAALEVAQARAENIPDWLLSVTGGATLGGSGLMDEIIGGVDYIASGFDPKAGQAARDAIRAEQAEFAADRSGLNLALQLGGGLLTPGLGTTGGWIGAASGGTRLARSGAVGAGYGALSGAANGEGGLVERADDTLRGAAVGAGVGALGQGVTDKLASAARGALSNPSAQRVLSRAGVDLTPGQMMGPTASRIEQGLESVPVLGDQIRSARARNLDTYGRAVIGDALSPIGGQVTARGRDAIREGDDLVSAAYSRVLDPLTIIPDAQFQSEVQAALNTNLSRTARNRLSDTVSDVLDRARGPVSGREFKEIESELTGLIQTATQGGPDGKPLVRPLRAIRDALRDNLRRQDPIAAEDLAATNAAFGNFDRVRRAAANPATARADGRFTPGNVNSVLARTEGRNYARGEARLQEFNDAAVGVLGQTVPDSGTPLRSLLQIGLPAAGGAAMAGQTGAAGIGAAVIGLGAIGYGSLAQKLLNAAYRASDPGSLQSALSELSRIASRDPAAMPYYQELVQALLPDLATERPLALPAPYGTQSRSEGSRTGLLSAP